MPYGPYRSANGIRNPQSPALYIGENGPETALWQVWAGSYVTADWQKGTVGLLVSFAAATTKIV